jgi:crotonobetainyl-CoA:carnitine CoA-transferase CaiB-like acyl-CoA transferase
MADPLAEAWRALTNTTERPSPLALDAPARYLASPFALDEIAVAAIGCALLKAAELAEARGGGRRPEVALDRAHAALAFASERHLRADGTLEPGFAPLSRFARTADGYIRLHANYPHHREALLRALDGPPDERAVLAAVAARGAEELEDAIVAQGGAAAAVRGAEQWLAHPQGQAAGRLPLIDVEPGDTNAHGLPPNEPLPCGGVRVLDFTRVIAGPVGTRMLAALGAEVLRVDPPAMPELELQVLDGMVGKRSAFVDARSPGGRADIERLLAGADVVVQGYRPGALAPLGLDAESLRGRHPHLVTVTLSAWGESGPWAERRGFDSLVQAACGIALACGEEGLPGALPVQALDHATGYLIAAAALHGLGERARSGSATHAHLALARTAAWVMSHRPPDRAPAAPIVEADPEPYLTEVSSPRGALRCLSPPGALDGRALAWPRGVPTPGADRPLWRAAGA